MLGRKVVKIKLYGAKESIGENLFKVWWSYFDYQYVWAKDELQAYQRVMRNETDEQNKE